GKEPAAREPVLKREPDGGTIRLEPIAPRFGLADLSGDTVAILIEDDEPWGEGVVRIEWASGQGDRRIVIAAPRQSGPRLEHEHLKVVPVPPERNPGGEMQIAGEHLDLVPRRHDDVLSVPRIVEDLFCRTDRVCCRVDGRCHRRVHNETGRDDRRENEEAKQWWQV